MITRESEFMNIDFQGTSVALNTAVDLQATHFELQYKIIKKSHW